MNLMNKVFNFDFGINNSNKNIENSMKKSKATNPLLE